MSRLSLKLVLIVSACAVVAGSATAAVSLASGPSAVRLGAAPLLPAGTRLVGSVSGASKLKVTVALAPRDASALQSYATAVATPGSSVYRHFLSVAQFRQRFAPTDAQIAAVESSLRARGLDPSPVTANGLAISSTATVGAVERAFSTTLERVALPRGGTAFANTTAPLLDSSVAHLVQGVIGLDDLSIPHPTALRRAAVHPHASKHVATGGPQPCSTATSVASSYGAYTQDQLAYAYRFSGLYGAGDEGAGQTVALYELEGNFPTDVTAFESCFGINASVAYSKVDGGAPTPNPNPPEEDGLETELDVDQAVALAPKANVIVYQGPNSDSNLPGSGPYDVYNTIISQDRAQVISSSWGECEAQDMPVPTAQQDENTLFQEAATQGQSVFAAAGDSGSEGCTGNNGAPEGGLAVEDPASQPFVTGAGGTRMPQLGPPPTESVWDDPADDNVCAIPVTLIISVPVACGGGGGISSLWKMPSYQSGAPASLHVINSNSSGTPCGAPAGTYCREVPDVSSDADPTTGVTVYYDGNGEPTDETGWENGTPLGGTSAAAPLWAALMADTNSSSACHGMPIGFANPALYGVADHAYSANFNDITSGNNDAPQTNNGLYPAGPAYDMASGLGTPNATALAASLCTPTVTVTNPGSQTSVIHNRASLQVAASDTGGGAITYSATGLPSGLSINSSTGAISGRVTKVGMTSVTVRAVDARSSFGTTTFGWTVEGLPTRTGGSLTGVGKGKPKLTFRLNAGTYAPGITKLVLSLPKGLSFSHKTKTLRKAISLIAGTGKLGSFKLKLSGGRLTITLPKAVKHLRVTVKTPGLSATRSLVKKVKRKTGGKLTVTFTVTDASLHSTKLTSKLKPS